MRTTPASQPLIDAHLHAHPPWACTLRHSSNIPQCIFHRRPAPVAAPAAACCHLPSCSLAESPCWGPVSPMVAVSLSWYCGQQVPSPSSSQAEADTAASALRPLIVPTTATNSSADQSCRRGGWLASVSLMVTRSSQRASRYVGCRLLVVNCAEASNGGCVVCSTAGVGTMPVQDHAAHPQARSDGKETSCSAGLTCTTHSRSALQGPRSSLAQMDRLWPLPFRTRVTGRTYRKSVRPSCRKKARQVAAPATLVSR